MATAFDYLVAASAYIYAFEGEEEVEFPESSTDFAKKFNEFYGKSITDDLAYSVMREFHRLHLITVVDDKYAGLIVSFNQDNFDRLYGQLADDKIGRFLRPLEKASEVYRRTLANDVFWQDISSELTGGAMPVPIQIPASDRIVTLSHNSEEGKLIIHAVDRIVDELQTNNALASEAGLERERYVSEAKAVKELIKADRISLQNLRSLIWSFFKEMASKFKEKAAEWSLEEVLSVLSKMLDLIK